jgi:hypothetical protein
MVTVMILEANGNDRKPRKVQSIPLYVYGKLIRSWSSTGMMVSYIGNKFQFFRRACCLELDYIFAHLEN